MDKHLIFYQKSLYEALEQMNAFGIKFLIVVNQDGYVLGTLTDGDVRRSILYGIRLEESVQQAACSCFTFVENDAGLAQVLAAFEDNKIEFLPVVDKQKKISNIITRRQLNVLLLRNEKFSIDFHFETLDENELEHAIFSRPWGFYKTTVLNNMFQSKVIYIMPGQSLSLQSHQRREEYWIVVSGSGTIQIGESSHLVVPGGTYFIPKGCKHRMSNTSSENTLIITEVQLGDYFGEDDIYRFEDLYNRE